MVLYDSKEKEEYELDFFSQKKTKWSSPEGLLVFYGSKDAVVVPVQKKSLAFLEIPWGFRWLEEDPVFKKESQLSFLGLCIEESIPVLMTQTSVFRRRPHLIDSK